VQIKEINEKETRSLESKITEKLVSAEENRLEKLNSVVERLREHASFFLNQNFKIDFNSSLLIGKTY
jgi:hypothetical protein